MASAEDFAIGRAGPTAPQGRSGPGSSALAGLCAVLTFVGLFGCANSSPFNQKFVEVRTANFHVISSLGEEQTRVLARDLEVFHAGVMAALGLDPDLTRSRPTEVIAFDGRGLSRPFSVRGAGASLIPTIDGPVLMIRAVGGFRERVDPDTRHRYAHRILRDLSKAQAPLWYEEGRAQIAATIEQSGDVVLVGRSRGRHRRKLLDWRHQDLSGAMERHSLAHASDADRERFQARTWAIVHTLLFDSPKKRDGMRALDSVRRAFESDQPRQLLEATRALGEGSELTARIYAHLEEERHRVDRFQLGGLQLADFELQRVPPVVARDRLANLALDLGRPLLAAEYFERALRDRPDYPPSLAGLVLADALAGRADRIDERAEQVATHADSDAVASSRLGLALVVSAVDLPAGRERESRLHSARELLERSLQLEPGRSQARIGMGMSFLAAQDDPDRAREFFEAVQRERPGALELELWLARVQLQLGRPNGARSHLAVAISRSHSRLIRKAAEEMYEEIEAQSEH